MRVSMRVILSLLFITTAVLATSVSSSQAQGLSITLPSSSIDSCQDYFTTEWSEPLDMNESTDILYNLVPREYLGLQPMSYSNGIASTVSLNADPSFRLLTWVDHAQGVPVAIPDDTTRFGINRPIRGAQSPFYDTLSFRMYTDKASIVQVFYDKQDGAFSFTKPFPTYGGWNVYSLDLRTAEVTRSSGDGGWETTPVTGIRFDPTGHEGANIKIDWMQLTPNAARCPSATLNYTRSGSGYATLVIDDDSNPNNGIVYRSPLQSSASGSVSVSTTKIFPGAYKVYGLLSSDYASTNIDPWDMDSGGTDIAATSMNHIDPATISYSSGAFCARTAGDDPYVFMNVPQDKPIDTAKFSKLSFDITISAPMKLQINTFAADSSVKSVSTLNINTNGRYDIDLGSQAGWTGDVYGLRFDLGDYSGTSFCLDNITLASTHLPSIPSPSYTTPLDLTFKERTLATFVQPDKEGGIDYFVKEKKNPSNFDSAADVTFTYGLSSLNLYPGNVYTDSGGALKSGDYVQGVNVAGIDDVNVGSVLHGPPINPDLYRIVCFDLDVLKPVDVYRTVARVLWFSDGAPINGDDLVIKTSGEKRYCLRMDTMPYEGQGAGRPHPWRFNGDGSGIDYFRVDPHEESDPTTFRLGDIRLASDHLANNRFAFVINGSTNKNVDLYIAPLARSTSGGVLIGSLAAGRASQVFVWDSSSQAEGFVYPYLVVDGNTYYADAPVRISRNFSDSTRPILSLYNPTAGYRFVNQMQLAGYVLDDVRVATVEVKVDGVLVGSVAPALFDKGVRDLYPTYPYASQTGFNRFIDLSGLIDGEHTLSVVAYDTSGNATEVTGVITKSPVSPSEAFAYPVANEGVVSLATSITPTPVPADLRILKAAVSAKGVADLQIVGTGGAACTIDVSLGKVATAPTESVGSYVFSKSKGSLTARKIAIHKKTGPVYVFAKRRCQLSLYDATSVRTLSYKPANSKVKNLKGLAVALKKGLKVAG